RGLLRPHAHRDDPGGVTVELEGQRAQQRERRRVDLGRLGRPLPLDRAGERGRDVDPLFADDHQRLAPLVGAPVFVVDAGEGLRFGRALVVRVVERVAILVGRGASWTARVGRRPRWDRGAEVGRVGHAVFVVVRIGTAVGVFETIFVFGFVGTLVELVEDAV